MKLRFALLFLALLTPWAASACDTSLKYSVYPTHLMIEGDCKTPLEAQAACTNFMNSLGQPGSCAYNEWGSGAGWYSKPSGGFFFGRFFADAERTKPERNMGAPDCPGQCFGDPINAGNGNKFESKVEYLGEGPFPLEFSWTYNYLLPPAVLPPNSYTLGGNRTFNYGSRVGRWSLSGVEDIVVITRPDGKVATFRKLPSGNEWIPALGLDARLRQLASGWEYQDQDGHFESFDADGRLKEIRSPDGYRQTLEYDAAGRLLRVTDFLGRTLGFQYNASDLIAQLNLPDERAIKFSYTPNNQLNLVEYQDGSKTKYLYDEAEYVGPNTTRFGALTGVEDESGSRYSSTRYDRDRALSTELFGSLDSYSASYTASPNGTFMTYTAINLPSGAQRKLNLTGVNGKILPKKVVTECTNCTPRTVEYTYDTNGRYDVVNDNGITTDYDFDTYGQVLKQVEAANDNTGRRRTTQTDWHPDFRAPTARRVYDAANALAANEAWTYNARGQMTTHSRLDAIGSAPARTTTTTYCEQDDVDAGQCPVVGLPILVNGPRTDVADTLRYTYYTTDDSGCAAGPATCGHRKGDVWKVTNALNQPLLEMLRYDGAGRALSFKDGNGVVTDYEYGARGWLAAIKVRGPNNTVESDDRITRFNYRPTGLVERITLPDGDYLRYEYDGARRLIGMIDQAGNTLHYTLDASGNRLQEDIKTASGALKRTMTRVFNLYGEVSAVKDSAQNATGLTYDARGNPDRTTDALGRVTDQDYDPLKRLIHTLQDATGTAPVSTTLAYNALDQITQFTDPKGLNTVYAYNGLGDQIKLTSPDTGVTDYTYDAAGLLLTKKDANDADAHRYTYDVLNRPKATFYTATGPADVEYDYDTVHAICAAGETFAMGRITAMRTESTQLQYCYDRFGQIVRKVQTVDSKSFTLRYAYTAAGRLQSVTYPDGAIAQYTRDLQGRIARVDVAPAVGPSAILLQNATYQPFGPVDGWQYGNGRTLLRSYDLDYRPKSVFDSASGGLSLGYVYDEVGDIKELKDGLLSASLAKYDYDTLGRLKSTRDGPTGTALETYGYDATGNRTSLLRSGITDTYNYPSTSHRLSSIGATTRSYDAVGNTIAIGGTAKEYVYNANDRMKQVKQGGVVTMGYRYNAKGERVAAISGDTGPVTTYTLYDETGHWIGDYDSTGAAIQQAIWMEDAPVGLLAGAGSVQSLKYVQPDHLGTPRAVIDPSRNVAIWTWDAKSEAFGNSPPNQDPDLDGTAFVFNMRFPGQRFDAGSGFVYNYFRDYDPATGRYLQSDPIGMLGGLNTFAYVSNGPMSAVDPFGLAAAVAPIYPARGFIRPTGTELALALRVLMAGGATTSAYATGGALLLYSPSLGVAPCETMGSGACARMYNEKLDQEGNKKGREGNDSCSLPPPRDPCAGLQKQADEHRQKLFDYMSNPLANDNRGVLTGASPEIQEKIYQGRVTLLAGHLAQFELQLAQCRKNNGG